MNYQKLTPIITFFKNKFVIASIAFMVWMSFFDQKDIGLMYDRSQKLKTLKQSEKHLTNQIQQTKKELVLLKSNAESIETYARENFNMKKDNEDLFIVK